MFCFLTLLKFLIAFLTKNFCKNWQCTVSAPRGNLYRWFTNYLTDRKQALYIDSVRSAVASVTSGVPQGSVLGPTLFLIYMNDFDQVLKHCHMKLYADDAKVYLCYSDSNDVQFMQHDLNAIVAWAGMNQLKLAFDKCNIMHMGYSNSRYSYHLGDSPVLSVSCIRDLGVTVTNTMKFSDHCQKLAKTGFQKVNLIFSAFRCHSRSLLCQLFTVFVLSKLEYASEIWNPFLQGDVDLLERVQRLFTRRLPGFSGMNYDDILKRLGWLKLADRRIHKDLIMVYKILHGIVDINPDAFFSLHYDVLGVHTRGHPLKLVAHRSRTEIRRNFFTERIVKYWNCLPHEVVTSENLNLFKSRVKKFVFTEIHRGRVSAVVRTAQPVPL
jgi:hypothetical protein